MKKFGLTIAELFGITILLSLIGSLLPFPINELGEKVLPGWYALLIVISWVFVANYNYHFIHKIERKKRTKNNDESVNKEPDYAKLERQRLAAKQKEEYSVKITITSGKKLVSERFGAIDMWQQKDGYIYFDKDDSKLYELLGYTWDGAQYKTISVSNTKGNDKHKVKKKGRLTGAVVGTMIAPGIGTAIGAMAGTGNKVIDGKNQAQTIINERREEIDSPATIRLRRKDTNELVSLVINCNTSKNNELSMFVPTKEKLNAASTKIDDEAYAELKKIKDLLDMGILTQEEFDLKKKEILGL